tara:strand:- start:3268 stop:5025 length:1758 start_codon:yes stop_codon:yes gene_type:complete
VKSLKKISSLISYKDKKFIFFVFFGSIISVLLETFSIGLVVPFVTSLIDAEKFQSYQIVQNLMNSYNITDRAELINFSVIIFLLVFLFKNIYFFFYIYIYNKLILELNFNLNNRLFKKYLNSSYLFYSKNNSSELIKNIIGEVPRVVQLIGALISLAREFLILSFIIILLIFFDSESSIYMILILGISGYLILKLTKQTVVKEGFIRSKFQGSLLKTLNQTFNSFREIILSWNQNKFSKIFNISQFKLLNSTKKITIITSMPRLILEIIVIAALSIFILFALRQNENLVGILPIISLYAVAAARLSPSLQKFVADTQQIRYCHPALENIYNEFRSINLNSKNISNKKSSEEINFDNYEVKIEKINFQYPNENNEVLKNISFSFKKGEIIGIVGKSGSGKTTLMNLLLGLLEPTNGKISVNNIDLKYCLESWQKKIGYVSQSVYLLDESIKNNISYFSSEFEMNENAKIKKIYKVIEDSQLSKFIKGLPDGIDTIIGENGVRISGGQKQRIGIARALYSDVSLIFFDESTSSLDSETESLLLNEISKLKRDKTIILISHKESTLKFCDKVIFISDGKINIDKKESN